MASFFRAHHPHVKQMCEIADDRYVEHNHNIGEFHHLFSLCRLFHSVQVHVETCVIVKYVEMASNQCMKWLQNPIEQGHLPLTKPPFHLFRLGVSDGGSDGVLHCNPDLYQSS